MWLKTNTPTTVSDPTEILEGLQSDGVSLSIEELLNYQNKSSLIHLATTKNLHGQLAGNYLARTKGRGMEFDEVRHYQPAMILERLIGGYRQNGQDPH